MGEPATRHDELRSAAADFHQQHPEVWKLFLRFTLEKIHQGYSHFGAKAVMERVRWETAAGGKGAEVKINNNFCSFYARRFERLYPQHAGFFRKRTQKSKQAPARQQPEPGRFELEAR